MAMPTGIPATAKAISDAPEPKESRRSRARDDYPKGMIIDVLTLFPGMFNGPLDESILQRARNRGLLDLRIHNLRDWTHDRHRTVDDRPFGGGPGMVLKCEPVFEAVESLRQPETRVVLMCPTGEPFRQETARRLAAEERLLIICPSYEGIDERIRTLVDEEISVGDFVLTNGNLPAMMVIDAVTRLLPGALGDETSAADESFSHGLLEYPQYTRPAEFRGLRVPEILLSGNHAEIERWRRDQAVKRTAARRPDLVAARPPAGVGAFSASKKVTYEPGIVG
jgi:tRNA (guanine37-N1)-methyltransferase